jgi:hypothetical protein
MANLQDTILSSQNCPQHMAAEPLGVRLGLMPPLPPPWPTLPDRAGGGEHPPAALQGHTAHTAPQGPAGRLVGHLLLPCLLRPRFDMSSSQAPYRAASLLRVVVLG